MTDPYQHSNSPERIIEDVAKMNPVTNPNLDDLYESEEYQRFIEEMVPYCHCARNRPCDGVLAGGMCDDIQEDEWDYVFDDEEEV